MSSSSAAPPLYTVYHANVYSIPYHTLYPRSKPLKDKPILSTIRVLKLEHFTCPPPSPLRLELRVGLWLRYSCVCVSVFVYSIIINQVLSYWGVRELQMKLQKSGQRQSISAELPSISSLSFSYII